MPSWFFRVAERIAPPVGLGVNFKAKTRYTVMETSLRSSEPAAQAAEQTVGSCPPQSALQRLGLYSSPSHAAVGIKIMDAMIPTFCLPLILAEIESDLLAV